MFRSALREHLCIFYGSQNKCLLVSYLAMSDNFYNRYGVCLLCVTNLIFKYNSDLFLIRLLELYKIHYFLWDVIFVECRAIT
jgi:hypothetical protein